MALESWVLGLRVFNSGVRLLHPTNENLPKRMLLGRNTRYPFPIVSNCVGPFTCTSFQVSSYGAANVKLLGGARLRMRCVGSNSDCLREKNAVSKANLKFIEEMLVKRGIINCLWGDGWRRRYGECRIWCHTWPIVLKVLRLFKGQGLLLALLLGLSAFFSLEETSITTLWP